MKKLIMQGLATHAKLYTLEKLLSKDDDIFKFQTKHLKGCIRYHIVALSNGINSGASVKNLAESIKRAERLLDDANFKDRLYERTKEKNSERNNETKD